jgi:hypothetical protein
VLAWLGCAFVAWNVVFDHGVYVAAARFAQASIERHQQGQPPVTIAAGYQPLVRAAAARATLWAAAILVVGLAVLVATSTRGPATGAPADAVPRRT